MNRLANILIGLSFLLLGLVVWVGAAALADTALLRGSPEAQAFFIGLLAEMQWSGRAILLITGAGLVLCSLVELLAWPGNWLWRQSGPPLRVVLAVIWAVITIIEVGLMAWGFALWAVGAYLAIWNGPEWGLWLLALLIAPLAALGPEWLWRRGFGMFRTI
jgi:hypothetical protein